MFTKPILFCPVCNDHLGYLTKGEPCSYICHECQWVFTWGRDGKLRSPKKLTNKVVGCDCGSCQFRDEQKVLNNLKRT